MVIRRAVVAVAALLATAILAGCFPLPEPAATEVTTACNDLAVAVQPYGVNTVGLAATCTAAVRGTESDLLRIFLASPQLGCSALAGPITALLPPVAEACRQFATAILPYSSLLGGALTPIP